MLTGKNANLKGVWYPSCYVKRNEDLEAKKREKKKNKKKTQHKTNNQLVYEEDHSSCMTSRNGMGRDSLAQVRAPNTHSLPTGVTISSANNLLDKNITSALLPQTDE